MSDEGEARDRRRGMNRLSGLRRSKSGIEDRGRALSKREGFGDWLRDIRRARGRI